ncbi:MAG TPA: hypothetical protein VFM14_03275 [Gemmatimonadales bacterium]|nr:hypothetical protein [Gemmatimonadales bacterium]
MNQPDIDPEKLAALMDGRLADAERTDLLAHLARSPEALEIHADAAAVLGELESKSGKVVPLVSPRAAGGRRLPPRWLAAAAILAGVALAGPLFYATRSDPDGAGFSARLREHGALLPAGVDDRPWTTVRGAVTDALTPGARAGRAGALSVDLEIAVWSRDTAAASRLASELAALLGGVPAGAPVAAMYHVAAQRAAAQPEELQPLLDRAADAAGKLTEPDVYRLAAWAEASRIAAAQRRPEFFQAGENRSLLEWASEIKTLPEGAAPVLERLRSALPSPGVPDWTALDRDLAELLRVLGS